MHVQGQANKQASIHTTHTHTLYSLSLYMCVCMYLSSYSFMSTNIRGPCATENNHSGNSTARALARARIFAQLAFWYSLSTSRSLLESARACKMQGLLSTKHCIGWGLRVPGKVQPVRFPDCANRQVVVVCCRSSNRRTSLTHADELKSISAKQVARNPRICGSPRAYVRARTHTHRQLKRTHTHTCIHIYTYIYM